MTISYILNKLCFMFGNPFVLILLIIGVIHFDLCDYTNVIPVKYPKDKCHYRKIR